MTSSDFQIEFGELPPRLRSPIDWSQVADKLRANPMQWAKVKVGARANIYSYVSRIRSGYYPQLPVGQFEVTARSEPDRRIALWLRFVGQP